MPSEDQQTDVTHVASPTLYCPNCSYNLTGLPENRCPECGEAFDPDELTRRLEARAKPITLGALCWALLWPPLVLAAMLLTAVAVAMPGAELLVFAVGAYILFSCLWSGTLADRVIASWPIKRSPAGQDRDARALRSKLLLALLVSQWLISLFVLMAVGMLLDLTGLGH